MEGCYSETVSRRYTHRGACCESNALLWLDFYGLLWTLPEYESMSRKDAIMSFSEQRDCRFKFGVKKN